MHYVELLNFENVLPVVEFKVFKKFQALKGSENELVIWQSENSSHPRCPDISFIYAPRLSIATMELLVKNARSNCVILYAAMRPMSGVHLINSIDELDVILNLISVRRPISRNIPPSAMRDLSDWKNTVPIEL